MLTNGGFFWYYPGVWTLQESYCRSRTSAANINSMLTPWTKLIICSTVQYATDSVLQHIQMLLAVKYLPAWLGIAFYGDDSLWGRARVSTFFLWINLQWTLRVITYCVITCTLTSLMINSNFNPQSLSYTDFGSQVQYETVVQYWTDLTR